ncbi:zinc finger protein 862-like [Mya arenaria]|uniref:zinc finger protein 862-like n=1 Tax=Mya arenaria TaxID=6604 RepID=UPI0022DF8E90|nr:zinc finger protein 862-like [Mya arenaria]
MNFLRYSDGAMPGRKASTSSNEQKKRAPVERRFANSWKEGRPWLMFNDETKVMTCSTCVSFYGTNPPTNTNLKGQNRFILGCGNMRVSAVVDHEKSKSHQDACSRLAAKSASLVEVSQSKAGKTLTLLKASQRSKLAMLFRNVHAIVKNNRPLRDYVWMYDLDVKKDLFIGETYRSEKSALPFLSSISDIERQKTTEMVKGVHFLSFLMDGSTDISGDEQEAVFIRIAEKGVAKERFLAIGSPDSTSSQDLYDFTCEIFTSENIDTDKLVGMGSDGASNMTGKNKGLAALYRHNVNQELVNVHCFAHRLELAFRDVVKTSKLHDKLMTLLIGLHYFYIKQYKNKHGLMESINALNIKGTLPPKVTGTRWMSHFDRGITSLTRTFQAYEAHLSSLSHTNPKAEGLYKIMVDKSLICYALSMKEIINPLMRLSLRLQKENSTLAESLLAVSSCLKMLQACKGRTNKAVAEVIDIGSYQGVRLRGNTPNTSYVTSIIDGFTDAINSRFDFGVEAVRQVCNHFSNTLYKAMATFDTDEAVNQWNWFKNETSSKFEKAKEGLRGATWKKVYDDSSDSKMAMLIVDLLLTLPPTSVSCETCFSQMKLVKTCRRTRLQRKTLNDLLVVRLASPSMQEFNPDQAIDHWMNSSVGGRRLTYKRQKRA